MPCAPWPGFSMSLADARRAIRPLLDEHDPADAAAAYYALYHPDEKTQIVTYQDESLKTRGFVCLARTGIDLFRPLVTLRLPTFPGSHDTDLTAGNDLIYRAIPEGMPVIISGPSSYQPLLGALFDIQREEKLRLFVLKRSRFRPVINVLVTRADSYNGLPRFIVRETSARHSDGKADVAASAGINWQSPRFAEIYVHTKTPYRRQGLGRSVVASLVQYVIESRRTPLYVVGADNQASIDLATSVGFTDTGYDGLLVEGTLNPRS